MAAKHDQLVMHMNEVRLSTSGGIQCAGPSLLSMINEAGDGPGPEIPIEQETTMLKTISAALLATSLIAAPAFAAGSGKATATTPAAQSTQTTQAKSDLKADAKTDNKTKAMNSNAKMTKHHRKHVSHLRSHKQHKLSALKTKTITKSQAKAQIKASPKVSLKQATPSSKRG